MAPNESLLAPTRERTVFHINSLEHGKNTLEKYRREGRITDDDATLIRQYIQERRNSRHLSVGRINKIIYSLLLWRRYMTRPFKEQTITDLYDGIETLTNGKKINGKVLKKNTLFDTVGIIKPFYQWMIDEGYSTLPEKKLRAIKRPSQDTMTKTAADLLIPDEITKIIQACGSSRDRALITMMYEGGFRIGELGNLTWGDMKFDEYGVVVNTNKKTGKPRYLRLISSREALAAWQNDYPFPKSAQALVFVDHRKKGMTYHAMRKQIQRIAVRAGIEKRVHPHIFRHSRITHLIQEGVSESVIKLMMWGSVDSDMFKNYLHLSGQDVDRAMLEHHKIKQPETKRLRKIEPRQCASCSTINGPTSNFCSVCGIPLTEEARGESEQEKTKVSKAFFDLPIEDQIEFLKWKQSQKEKKI